jgi:hypothetical protein
MHRSYLEKLYFDILHFRDREKGEGDEEKGMWLGGTLQVLAQMRNLGPFLRVNKIIINHMIEVRFAESSSFPRIQRKVRGVADGEEEEGGGARRSACVRRWDHCHRRQCQVNMSHHNENRCNRGHQGRSGTRKAMRGEVHQKREFNATKQVILLTIYRDSICSVPVNKSQSTGPKVSMLQSHTITTINYYQKRRCMPWGRSG